jgi:parallel beta-helix repeat protein
VREDELALEPIRRDQGGQVPWRELCVCLSLTQTERESSHMTHTFKLARRLARLRPGRERPGIQRPDRSCFEHVPTAAQALVAAALVAFATGCTDDKLSEITSTSQPDSDTARASITTAVATCVSTATMLCPGDNLRTKITAAGSGATLTFQPGIYRMQTITPKTGQSFIGQPGAVLSGAKRLTGWVRSGTVWYVTGQTQEFDRSTIPSQDATRCQAGYPCQYPHDVYRDNVPLTRVASLASVRSGKFYFDYSADRIYVGDSPGGHKLEVATTPYAFEGTAQGAGSGVTIKGLVIEKYATPTQQAAVGHSGSGANWIIRNNEIRFNHGIGVRTGSGMQLLDNNIHHNGQMGVGGGGTNVVVGGNVIAYNNTARYDYGWEGGGTKFVATRSMRARGNFVHHNRGPGLWWDGNNDGALIEGNRVEDNVADGIFWEISYSATIRNNSISRNGFGRTYPSEGGGILLNSSGAPTGKTINIYGNTLVGNKEGIIALQASRGSGALGPWVVQNLSVHDNTVQLIAGGNMGIDRYGGDAGVWTTRNNHFEHNSYNLQTAPVSPFIWAAAYKTDAQWKAYGNDNTGSFRR